MKQFYFGEEAVESRLKPDQLPFPKSTWKDLYNRLNDEYEGLHILRETFLCHIYMQIYINLQGEIEVYLKDILIQVTITLYFRLQRGIFERYAISI